MEIRFRLNSKNESDKAIIDFLENEYSPNETIKAILYKMAICNDNGTTLAFWGKGKTYNTDEEMTSLPEKDDRSELRGISVNIADGVNKEGQDTIIGKDLMSYFK